MSAAMSRRKFFGACGASAAATGLLIPQSAFAHDYPFDFYLKGDGWDSYGRRDIVRQAMSLINDRFAGVYTTTNGYEVEGDRYNMEGDLWDITNLNSYYSGKGYRDILWYQMIALRSTKTRPDLNIHAEYDKDKNAVGWANTNTVKVKFSKEGFVIEGEFNIALNTYFLGGGGHYKDPYYWAGTIAHEMLHNLGHLHLEKRDDPKYSECQLIAHERAVYYDAKYRRGLERPVVLCGGRWKN